MPVVVEMTEGWAVWLQNSQDTVAECSRLDVVPMLIMSKPNRRGLLERYSSHFCPLPLQYSE
jgi:hypothetical protein